MKVLIVDDEIPARQRLRGFLEKEPDVEILAECANGHEALDAIVAHSPDLIFLDIQMPGMNGFDVLRELPEESRPFVIFITAYDEHAVRAFEVNALDYLLKPFPRQRLTESLERARATLAQGGSVSRRLEHLLRSLPAAPASYPTRLIVRDGTKSTIHPLADVICFAAEGNYAEVFAADGRRLLLRETMQSLENRLDPARFFRASRSLIIHLIHLKEIVSEGRSGHTLRMSDGSAQHLTAPLEDLQKRLSEI